MRFLKYCIVVVLSVWGLSAKAVGFTVPDTNVCVGSPLKFKDTSTVPAGLTVINRVWNFDGVNIANSTADSIYHTYAASDIGNYYTPLLTIFYNDGSSVAVSMTNPKNVFIRAIPTVAFASIQDTISCPGVPISFSVTSSAGSPNGGTLVSWKLDYGDGNFIDIFTPTNTAPYTYTASGNYKVVYTVTDQFGCVAKAAQDMTIMNNPNVTFTPILPRCKDSVVIYENRTPRKNDLGWQWNWTVEDSSFVIGSLGQDSLEYFSFTTRNTMDANVVHQYATKLPNKYQKVTLRGQNIHRCVGTSVQFFRVDTTPILVIEPSIDTTICFGESIKYTVRGSDTLFYSTFLWGNKIKGDSVVLFTPKNTITYTVYGKTSQCPPSGKDIKIRVVQPISTNITLNPSNILRGSLSIMELNTAAVFDSIRWNPSTSLTRPQSDSTGASPQISTMYRARVYYSLDNYVCYHDDSAFLKVDGICQVDSLKIPTAFTPNGDNLNDEFYIKSFALKRINTFNVYNRWGDKVFHIEDVPADDKDYGWNGKKNNDGDDLPPGVYIYNISAICKNDQMLNFQGEITILR